jgi:hypothetical protein
VNVNNGLDNGAACGASQLAAIVKKTAQGYPAAARLIDGFLAGPNSPLEPEQPYTAGLPIYIASLLNRVSAHHRPNHCEETIFR